MPKHPFFATLALMATSTVASGYQLEIAGHFQQKELDENRDANSLVLEGTYYFSPVQIKHHVLGEAAFLERANSIHIDLDRTEYTQPSHTVYFEDTNSDPDEFNYSYSETYPGTTISDTKLSLKGEWYLAGELLYLGLGLDRYGQDFPNRPDNDTQWNASLGITPAEGLLISTDFYEDQELDNDWNVGVKYVTDRLGPTFAINANIRHLQREEYLTFGVDYYVDRTLSIGVEAQENRLNTTDLEVRARKFLTDSWSISAHYFKTDSVEWYGGNATEFSVGTSHRF